MNDSSLCVLSSGGLDSAALIGHMSRRYHRIYPVYVRQGLAWERAELYWLRRFLRAMAFQKNIKPLTLFKLPMEDVYGRHWSLGYKRAPGARTSDRAVYLPGRNPLLTLKPAIFCAQRRIPRLAVGSLNHNPFADATPAFFALWSKALSQALGKPLRVLAPFRHLSKARVIHLAHTWPLHLSFSCLSPRGLDHCGQCNKCAERRKAFRLAGIEDRTRYVS